MGRLARRARWNGRIAAVAYKLHAVVSLEWKQTIIVRWPRIVRRLGTRGENARCACRVALYWRHLGVHMRLAFAPVLRIHFKGALECAVDVLCLPDHITGAGCDIVTIFLVNFRCLAALEVLLWGRYFGPVINATVIAVDPPLHVDRDGFRLLVASAVGWLSGLQHMSRDNRK